MGRVYEIKHYTGIDKSNVSLGIPRNKEESLGIYKSYINAYEDLSGILDLINNNSTSICMYGKSSDIKLEVTITNIKKKNNGKHVVIIDTYTITQITLKD